MKTEPRARRGARRARGAARRAQDFHRGRAAAACEVVGTVKSNQNHKSVRYDVCVDHCGIDQFSSDGLMVLTYKDTIY